MAMTARKKSDTDKTIRPQQVPAITRVLRQLDAVHAAECLGPDAAPEGDRTPLPPGSVLPPCRYGLGYAGFISDGKG